MYIVSILVDNRADNACEIQEILTKYGKNINARLGVQNPKGENTGIIIVVYTEENIEEFVKELNSIENVSVNYMEA